MGILLNGSQWVHSTVNYVRTSTDHTVSFWARLDGTGAVRRPFGNTGNWEMRTDTGTTLTSDLLQAGTLGSATLTVGTYHHIGVVQDVTGGSRFFYLDGALVNTVATATFAAQQTGIMRIGEGVGGTNEGWLGALDDLRIYNRVMPLEEIQTIYAVRGTDGILDGIEHWWPLDDGGQGQTITALRDIVAGLDCTVVTGTPTFEGDAGIKRRRIT